MYGKQQYIEQNIPNGAVFSPILYTPSAVVGAVQGVQKDYTAKGAKFIIVSTIIISVIADVAAHVTFTNEFGQTMFLIAENTGSNGIYDLPYIFLSGTLTILSNNANIRFSIGHQYITVADVKRN